MGKHPPKGVEYTANNKNAGLAVQTTRNKKSLALKADYTLLLNNDMVFEKTFCKN